MHWTPTSCSWN